MKTVLFGGTFDPPHLGHKMIIEELIKMDFDSILVLPNKKPDYKKVSATDRQRLDMLKIMTDKMGDKVKICNFELSQDEFTPTAKVIQFLKNELIWFLLGLINQFSLLLLYRRNLQQQLLFSLIFCLKGIR